MMEHKCLWREWQQHGDYLSRTERGTAREHTLADLHDSIQVLLADPGEARGCSMNVVLIFKIITPKPLELES